MKEPHKALLELAQDVLRAVKFTSHWVRACKAFDEAANPTAIIALITELEAANKRIAKLESTIAREFEP